MTIASSSLYKTENLYQYTFRYIRAIAKSLVLFLWILIGIFTELLLLSWIPSNHTKRTIIQAWHKGALVILGVKVHLIGTFSKKAQLVCANHISWLDILVIASQTPSSFIAKEDIKRWPLIGVLATLAGTVYIRRSAQQHEHFQNQLGKALSQRNRVVFFPEGTTSTGESTLPFKAFIFRIAVTQCIAVQPLCIRYRGCNHKRQRIAYVGEDHLIDNIWSLLLDEPVEVDIVALSPISPAIMHGLKVLDTQLSLSNPVIKSIAKDMADKSRVAIESRLLEY